MNAAKRFILSESTLMPLSLAMTLAGGIYWLSGVQFATAQNKVDIQLLAESENKFRDSITDNLRREQEMLSAIQVNVGALDAKIQILVRYAKSAEPGKY